MLKNYHSHTERCGHAWGTDDEFVQAAIEAGYTTLGFSEHAPWPFVDGYQEIDTRQRIPLEDLDNYLADMQALKDKYKDQIEIKVGFEAEYYPEYFPQLVETVKKIALHLKKNGSFFGRADDYLKSDIYKGLYWLITNFSFNTIIFIFFINFNRK